MLSNKPLSQPSSLLKLKEDRVQARFEPKEHRYFGPNGEVYTSVTQAMRIYTEKAYEGIPKETLKRKAELGTAVHLATEYYDEDDLDIGACNPKLIPYIDAYARFKEEIKPEIIFKELRLIHPRRFYAGAIDRVVFLDDSFWIIDLKTTRLLYEFVGIQLAAYAELLNANLECPIPFKRAALQLKDDGTYVFSKHEADDDWYAFLACLTLNNWNINHGSPFKYRL